ncbi:hypothetical protein KUCAC02_017000, partial [Chaenocephalus aceratus]
EHGDGRLILIQAISVTSFLLKGLQAGHSQGDVSDEERDTYGKEMPVKESAALWNTMFLFARTNGCRQKNIPMQHLARHPSKDSLFRSDVRSGHGWGNGGVSSALVMEWTGTKFRFTWTGNLYALIDKSKVRIVPVLYKLFTPTEIDLEGVLWKEKILGDKQGLSGGGLAAMSRRCCMADNKSCWHRGGGGVCSRLK